MTIRLLTPYPYQDSLGVREIPAGAVVDVFSAATEAGLIAAKLAEASSAAITWFPRREPSTNPTLNAGQTLAAQRFVAGMGALAVLGDSRFSSYNGLTVAGVTQKKASGPIVWATKLAGMPRAYSPARNFAVDGSTWDDVVALQMPQFIASPATVGIVLCGLNDVYNAGRSFSWIVGKIQQANDLAFQAGKVLFNCIDAPRSAAAADPLAQRQLSMKINAWHRAYCQDRGIPWVDLNAVCVGADGANQVPTTRNWMQDNSHQAPQMAYAESLPMVEPLKRLLPQEPTVLPFDLYDASANPQGNLVSAPWMTGTSGSKSGTPTPTGNVATGFTLSTASMSGSGSVVGSKETVTLDNGATYDKQVITFANAAGDGGANEEIRYILNIIGSGALSRAANGIAAGDTIQVGIYVEVTAHANCEAVALRAVDNNGSTSVEHIDMARVSGFKLPAAPLPEMLLITEPFVVGAYSGSGNQSISLRLTGYMDSNNGGSDPSSLTLKVSRPFIRNLSA